MKDIKKISVLAQEIEVEASTLKKVLRKIISDEETNLMRECLEDIGSFNPKPLLCLIQEHNEREKS